MPTKLVLLIKQTDYLQAETQCSWKNLKASRVNMPIIILQQMQDV